MLYNRIFLLLQCFALPAMAQSNFTYTPERPRPGDLVTISYTPAGALKGITRLEEATAYQIGQGLKATDMVLSSSNGKLTGTFRADTATSFAYFVFTEGEKTDNNNNKGYRINFYTGDQAMKGSYAGEGTFYSGNVWVPNVEKNYAEAIACYEKEFALYPESRKAYVKEYLRAMIAVKEQEGLAQVQKEMETILKDGLKEEADYKLLESLYEMLQLPEQSRWVKQQKRERFPNGKWVMDRAINNLYAETDPVKKSGYLNEVLKGIETNPDHSALKERITAYKKEMASVYIEKKDWEGFKKAITDLGLTDKAALADLYNNAAWQIQETGKDLDYAAGISKIATEYARAEWQRPSSKPDYFSAKLWNKQCATTYGMYADTYGMILFKTGQYKKGLPFAREAALVIAKGENADENNTYALLAEKVMPLRDYRKQLEQFVKENRPTAIINDILKRAYVKQNGSDKGFPAYMEALQKEGRQHMTATLRRDMLNETAPSFTLMDIEGQAVTLEALKGKVVVIDFWATWCVPCKASFPGMQKVVNDYKNNPDVVFLFIDTRESGKDKRKDAADFIAAKQYTFRVLLDKDNKVVEQFKVNGIPAKFILDKEGKIRFKTEGFGSEDELITELTAMIKLAGA